MMFHVLEELPLLFGKMTKIFGLLPSHLPSQGMYMCGAGTFFVRFRFIDSIISTNMDGKVIGWTKLMQYASNVLRNIIGTMWMIRSVSSRL